MSLFLADLVKEKGVKPQIVKILSRHGSLRLKEINLKLHSDYGTKISNQAVYKALKELKNDRIICLRNKTYCLNSEWLSTVFNFADISLSMLAAKCPKAAACVMKVFENPDDFYKNMLPLFRTEKILRFSSKSPSIIIAKEADLTAARKKYVNELEKAILKKQIKVKYLISEDYTKELILKYNDSEAVERLQKLRQLENVQIRCAPTKAIMSYAVGKRDLFINPTAIAHDESIGTIYFHGDMSKVIKMFDIIFAEAKEVKELIEELNKKVGAKA